MIVVATILADEYSSDDEAPESIDLLARLQREAIAGDPEDDDVERQHGPSTTNKRQRSHDRESDFDEAEDSESESGLDDEQPLMRLWAAAQHSTQTTKGAQAAQRQERAARRQRTTPSSETDTVRQRQQQRERDESSDLDSSDDSDARNLRFVLSGSQPEVKDHYDDIVDRALAEQRGKRVSRASCCAFVSLAWSSGGAGIGHTLCVQFSIRFVFVVLREERVRCGLHCSLVHRPSRLLRIYGAVLTNRVTDLIRRITSRL